MRKSLLIAASGIALIAAPIAISQGVYSNSPAIGQSGVLTIDNNRGVLTMAPLLERITPAVVSIDVEGTSKPASQDYSSQEDLLRRFFGGNLPEAQNRPTRGLGSGVIIDASEGLIVTNNHVVEDADRITITLEDKRELDGKLIGSDPKTDIALVKVDAKNLSELKFAKSRDVRVGDYVIAVGNPFGLSSTVTSGIISALGRDQGGAENYQDYIQTDASINPGNSGGALVNSKGELIGINTAILSRSGGNNGIGFAVPTRIVTSVVEQLKENGEVRRGRIGVGIQNITPTLRESLNLTTLNGALVSSVSEGTPADKAGLKEGDVIVGFNGDEISDSSDIRNAVGLVLPGTRTDITYIRDGKRRTTRIEVAEVEEDREILTAEAVDDIPAMEAFSGASIGDIPDDVELRGGEKGVYVMSVENGSKAYRAGLRRGDVIRSVNLKDVSNLKDFESRIANKSGPFALSVEREGQRVLMAVK
ncbi:serine protease Do/serine protease DegQ [Litorimonas taeanensis]|uniref:Serine protease Do/serine protease DegQ n=1 Tax=Litorimonas taeanensis TaxID=568099 RepID=A0A420WD63_9PROT|nr:Do family serine endopeptidase [Litorimonas taeanensis]RKQ68918.1 serine protease Do/serine protease DegQ [Litorimonas taeanensis]